MTSPHSIKKGALFKFRRELGLLEIISGRNKTPAFGSKTWPYRGFSLPAPGVMGQRQERHPKITLKGRKNNVFFEKRPAGLI
jgi:hypothetical protein